MKIKKIAAVIGLVLASSGVRASESNTFSAVIRFTGEIVVGACNVPNAQWYQHAGRERGQSPLRAGAVPSRNGTCAGIADTRSVSFTPVSYAQNGSVKAGIVTVEYN
ncbi:hypothetical protein [Pseudomonas sp. LFM046]|uniref:hypothetical protein n=1 Tax=Pseudomonas sp. LFM046 TaxID=1608357 RepID=UPI0005CFE048|nr:hypothetical protein [Pseudomonas sp. LFM046]